MQFLKTAILIVIPLAFGQIVKAEPTSIGVFDEIKMAPFKQSGTILVHKAVTQIAQNRKLAAIFSSRPAWSAPGTKVIDVTDEITFKLKAMGAKAVPVNAPKPGLSPSQQDAVAKAIRTLRHLVSAYDAGVSYDDFKPRLIDARVDIDEQLRLVPEGDLHNEIERSLEGYEDAMTALNDIATLHYYSILKDTKTQQLLKKYSIPLDFTNDGGDELKKQISVNEVIDPMIAAGKKHLANAEKFLSAVS